MKISQLGGGCFYRFGQETEFRKDVNGCALTPVFRSMTSTRINLIMAAIAGSSVYKADPGTFAGCG